MKKEERLQELKEEEKFHKVLDKYFDAGWREFVKGIQGRNDLSNLRLLRILAKIKDADFVSDLLKLMGRKNKHARLELTKKPKGILLKDNRFPTIPELMILKYTTGAYREGEVYIPVDKERWVRFIF